MLLLSFVLTLKFIGVPYVAVTIGFYICRGCFGLKMLLFELFRSTAFNSCLVSETLLLL